MKLRLFVVAGLTLTTALLWIVSVRPDDSEGVPPRTALPAQHSAAKGAEDVTSAGTAAPSAPPLPSDKPDDDERGTGVLSEQWLDPEGKAVRRRVRIVQADGFKYPRLRKLEEVTVDPVAGEERVRLVHASVADHVMVGLREGVDEAAARRELEDRGYAVRASEPGSFLLVEVAAHEEIDAQRRMIEALAALDEFIDFSEPDYLVFPSLMPNDPDILAERLWGLHNPGLQAGSRADADIDGPEGWEFRTDASSVIVAVTDTGVRYTHDDLAGNMWVNGGETPGDGIDNDGNGVVDDIHGFDAQNDDGDPVDDNGHGTHVAGTIGAAGNNGIGIAGVAWSVQLMAVKFLGNDGGTTSDAIRSLNYARLNGADIINASWGGGDYSQGLRNAIRACAAADIVVVAAAGNEASDNDSTPHYPSNYAEANVVSVAASTSADTLSLFSNYGRYAVDLAAPGSRIWSSFYREDDDYKYQNGTSMAAPHVSGALALARAEFPGDTAEDLVARLWSSADFVDSLSGRTATGGRLNLARLLGASTPAAGNDDFAEALRFDEDYGAWAGSNRRATREPDEDSFSVPSSGVRSLWFAWQAPADGLARFNVETEESGARILVFEGSAKASLSLVRDSGPGPAGGDQVSFYAQAGTEYRVAVDSAASTGHNLIVSLVLAPVNDLLTDAAVLSGDRFAATASTRGATAEPFELERPHGGVGRGRSVWWSWTASHSGEQVFSTSGSGFDTVLAVYTGDASDAASLDEVMVNDDRNKLDWTSQVAFPVAAGTTYLIAVDGYREDGFGEVVLSGFPVGEIVIAREPESRAVRLGEEVELSAGVAGLGLRYQWELDGELIAGATTPSYRIASMTPAHFGDYRLRVTDRVTEVVSEVATLSELRSAPTIRWLSRSQVAGEGESLTLGAHAVGSEPLSYQWSKDGVDLPDETGQSLRFAAVATDDAGGYRVRISNSEGVAESDLIELEVVGSPWERWQNISPYARGGRILKIVHGGGRWVALAIAAGGNGVLAYTSADGLTWETVILESVVAGRSLEGQSLCYGKGIFVAAVDPLTGPPNVLISRDGLSWTPSEVTLESNLDRLDSIEFHGNDFYATTDDGYVYRSTDGRNWEKMFADNEEVRGRALASGGTTLVTIFRDTAWVLQNGAGWVEIDLPQAQSFASGIVWHNGRFILLGAGVSMVSTNGLSWTAGAFGSGAPAPYDSDGGVTVHEGQIVVTLSDASVSSSNGTTWSRRDYPPHVEGTAVASANGMVVLGTATGALFSGPSMSGLNFPQDGLAFRGERIEHAYGEFLIYGRQDGSSQTIVFRSSDGESWHEGELVRSDTGQARSVEEYFFGGGFYWAGENWPSIHSAWRGLTPELLQSVRLTNDPEDRLHDLVEGPAGMLAVVQHDRDDSRLMHSLDGVNWSEIPSPIIPWRIGVMGDLYYIDGLSSGRVQVSRDLVNWTNTEADRPYAFLQHEGEYWILYHDELTPRFARSVDGESWQLGIPLGGGGAGFSRLESFQGTLVGQAGSGLRYSLDGFTWTPIGLSCRVQDFAVSGDTLVVLGTKGEVVRAVRSAVLAPVVEVVAPVSGASYVTGATVQVQAEVFDPDGAYPLTVRCYVDNRLVGEAVGEPYAFAVPLRESGAHVVRVEAEDADGAIGRDTMIMHAAGYSLPERIVLTEGNPLPGSAENFAVLDGEAWVLGDGELLRSADGERWERVPMLGFSGEITSILNENGVLVLAVSGAGGGGFISTDGVSWSHVDISPDGYFNGYFFTFKSEGGTTYRYTSRDAQQWERALVPAGMPSFIVQLVGDPFGVMLARSNLGQLSRSFDGGLTWDPPPGGFPPPGPVRSLVHDGSRFLIIENGVVKTTEDGVNWTTLPNPLAVTRLQVVGGRVLGLDSDGLVGVLQEGDVWAEASTSVESIIYGDDDYFYAHYRASRPYVEMRSRDGVDWEWIGPEAPEGEMYAAFGTVVVRNGSGALWRLEDDGTWREVVGERIVHNVGKDVYAIGGDGDTLVAAGRLEQIFTSQDGGRSWTTTRETPGSSLDGTLRWVEARDGVFLAWGRARTYRSIDGMGWSSMTVAYAQLGIETVAASPGGWLALQANGGVLRSDNALAWTSVAPAGTLPTGTQPLLTWAGDRWVMAVQGATAAQSTLRYSFDGVSWTDTGERLAGAERMVSCAAGVLVTADAEQLFTPDFASWYPDAMPFSHLSELAPFATDSAFYHLEDSVLHRMVDEAGWVPWQEVEETFRAGGAVGERIFLFSGDKVSELTDRDLELFAVDAPAKDYAVGEPVPVEFTIAAGATDTGPAELVVEGRLSRDGIFGNPDDIVLGERLVTVPALAARGTVRLAAMFSVPLGIDPGEFQVGLVLDPAALHYELSTANNRALSAGRAVVVPGWTLDVDALGDGDVAQDQLGILHAHGTQVTLSARAGKGARFVGWGGDAVGGLSELTVLMDGDKSIEARFSPAENLQVRIVGDGAATGANESGSYEPGEQVVLTAEPAEGWVFAGWSGAATGAGASVEVTIDGPKAVTARFVLPVATWRVRHFTPAELLDVSVSGDEADADGDGVTNGGEYRHGSDPRNPLDRGVEALRVEGGFLTMIYTRLQGMDAGYDLQVRGSRDAENWDEAVGERILSVDGGIETREARMPSNEAARGFLGFEY